jgi:hypothetical protein
MLMVLGALGLGGQAFLPTLKALSRPGCLGRTPLIGGQAGHLDAVDWAGRQAELAAGAIVSNHRVEVPECPNDGVGRADLEAQRTSNAAILIDQGSPDGTGLPATRVERDEGLTCQGSQTLDARDPPRRTTVDCGAACRNGHRIGPAGWITASLALRLWEKRIDLVWRRPVHDSPHQ